MVDLGEFDRIEVHAYHVLHGADGAHDVLAGVAGEKRQFILHLDAESWLPGRPTRYQVPVRLPSRAEADAEAQYNALCVPFSDLSQTVMGYLVDRQEPINASRVLGFGIMLAAADPGDFDLVIQRIDVLPISREA